MERVYKLTATFFGAGFSPYAPGTAGTIAAALLYGVLWAMNAASFSILLGCLTVLSIATIFSGTWAERHYKTKDPQMVVIDEAAGFFMTVLLFRPSFPVLFLGILLFRFFDILKPYPIKRLERLPGGTGILVDDLMASLYAIAILTLLSYVVFHYHSGIEITPFLWEWGKLK